MKSILITGSEGFIGKNLRVALSRIENIEILRFDIDDNIGKLNSLLKKADLVYHLAGVNRPGDEREFEVGNAGLTQTIVDRLKDIKRFPPILLTSSIQADLDNPYGKSKKLAEDILSQYSVLTGGRVNIYRLPNVFGKWCRPNYNSVVATFCYNICNGLDIRISDKNKVLELVYIDDVVEEFCKFVCDEGYHEFDRFCSVDKTYRISLGELAERVRQFKDMRSTLIVPNLADGFSKCLHATYISYLETDNFGYPLEMKRDNRGWLAELVKSKHSGQIFISKTNKGIIRGNHYHDSKVEKFCVVQGEAVIRFRNVLGSEILTYEVSGNRVEVIDIPPGYTHSIENVGNREMIVIFWANQIFDSRMPDTFLSDV